MATKQTTNERVSENHQYQSDKMGSEEHRAASFTSETTLYHYLFKNWCRGQDLNLRTPLREGLKPSAFDHLATPTFVGRSGGPYRIRTCDRPVKSRMRYQSAPMAPYIRYVKRN